MPDLKKFLYGNTTSELGPVVHRVMLVITLSLRHFQNQMHDLANTGYKVHKKNQKQYIVDGVLYSYVATERDLRGIRNVDGVEMWYGAGLRPDFGKLYDLIEMYRASGDIKDGKR